MSSKKLSTRENILAATSSLMQENQGAGAKMLDIAKAAGVSRQAIYLHFESRTELLVAATRYLDDQLGLAKRFASVNTSEEGIDRMDAFIDFWGRYIPHIYGIAKALLATKETDDAAKEAWKDRMDSVMSGCREAVTSLKKNGNLSDEWSVKDATEMLWTLLSIRSWENLTIDCGWSVDKYVASMQTLARGTFTKEKK